MNDINNTNNFKHISNEENRGMQHSMWGQQNCRGVVTTKSWGARLWLNEKIRDTSCAEYSNDACSWCSQNA
jgi:hypothetical protein